MMINSWKLFVFCLIGGIILMLFDSGYAQPVIREDQQTLHRKLLFDRGWKFHLGDAGEITNDFNYGLGTQFAKAGESTGPVQPTFDDHTWRDINLPHDWAVELEFVHINDEDVKSHGYKPVGRQFPKTTIGWYRRAFPVSREDEGKRFTVKFDGVFRDCIVWLNGHYLGRNLSGYSDFSFDITDYIRFDRKNVLVVRVDASQYEGWFYEGAGIYRHVWLLEYNPLHIPQNGIFVHTIVQPHVARVQIETDILNEQDSLAAYAVESIVEDNRGKVVGKNQTAEMKLDGWKKWKINQNIDIPSPHLWSPDDPYRYRLVSLIRSHGNIIDRSVTSFGIRSIRFDKDRGFFINDQLIKIKGVCCHQDHAGVGSALPDRLQFYRIERLKKMGCNAYRTSHNPPTLELLEACDSLGILVMDENRLMGNTPEIMNQFEDLILRDRNHPSVILWSIGNEEYVIQNTDIGKKIAHALIRRQQELDPTRLTTYAANNGNQYEGINSEVPIRGFNYMAITDIDKYHTDHPEQILLGSEEASTVCTRGIYNTDTTRGYLCDYDINKPGWGATAEHWWAFYAARPWLAGAFVWTGFDYRGEPTPYSWPCINSHFGIMDVCGFPKNNFYYYQSWWSNTDVLHIAPHWNWAGRENDTINIWCQSNCDTVELFLNGKNVGKKPMERNSHLEWNIPYQRGMIEARGSRNGKTIATRIETTDEPITIRLTPDRTSIMADGEDVSVVTVSVIDQKGREVPIADNLIRFELKGNGKIIGVGNGDPSSHEPDKFLTGNYQRHLFSGKCQVILQSSQEEGNLELIASSDGLKSSTAMIKTIQCEPRPSVPVYSQPTARHLAIGKNIEYKTTYSQRYTAGGNAALIDGILGTADFRDGLWQGFEQNDLVVVIDLGTRTKISSIESDFLNNIDSWIFLPKSVEYEISEDGIEFINVALVLNDVPENSPDMIIKKFFSPCTGVKARYIKVTAKNIGACPPWHRGAGGKAWIFLDEIIVK
jgi:beta-galactosidase